MRTRIFMCLGVAMGLLATRATTAAAADVGTSFTYQGQLTDGGAPANGPYDFEFRLYTGPWPTGFISAGPISVADVPVTDGLFTVKLNFGSSFTGASRWLDISVRPGSSSGAYTTLAPRQELTAAPYAMGLALPYTATHSSAGPIMTIDQDGNGNALALSSKSGDCIDAFTDGTGDAVYAHTTGAGLAIGAYTTGSGHAVYGQSTGGGTSVFGYNLGATGRAGFFRTEMTTNSSPTMEIQSNGTGHALVANARLGHSGRFENTNTSNTNSTLRVETNGAGLGFWSRTTGTSGAARIEVANTSNSSPALDVRTSGSGLAAKFTGGDVDVGGRLYAQIGTVKNRATPIAFGRFDASGNLLGSSGNVTITAEPNGTWRVFVVGEGDPDTWIVTTTVSYHTANTNLEYVAKPSRPFGVAGQPGNGVIYIKSQCMNDCQEFQIMHYVNFVIYQGV